MCGRVLVGAGCAVLTVVVTGPCTLVWSVNETAKLRRRSQRRMEYTKGPDLMVRNAQGTKVN